MRKCLFSCIFCLVLLVSCSTDNGSKSDEVGGNDVSQKDVSEIDYSKSLSDDIAAYKTVVNIIRETGLTQNFVVLPGDVKNVQAYVEHNERVLEYNPEFIEKLNTDSGWPGLSVLARQIGHHLSNHDLENGVPSIEEEIEADKYAGFVLYKMGADLDQAIEALNIVIKEDSVEVGISKNSRLASLTKGWKNAKTLMSDTLLEKKKIIKEVSAAEVDSSSNAVVDSTNYNRIKNNPNYVYEVFLAIDKSIYFVNKDNLVVQEVAGSYKAVGKKLDSDKLGFDWIFSKGGDSYGVDARGRLWAFSTDNNFYVVGQSVKLTNQ